MSSVRNTKRRTSAHSGNRIAIVTISLVVGFMACAVGVKVDALKKKEAYYRERGEVIAAQLAAEQERQISLDQYSKYVHTQEYVEKTAKEKLGLVNPDEVILKPEN